MTKDSTGWDEDRGAILVHVAIALLALVAFTTFVADYGALWTARRQAQNAADSAALAGAISLAWDNSTDLSFTGPAYEAAYAESQRNFIYGKPPDVQHTDITFGVCPDGSPNCIRVNVYRTADRGNPLPMFFGYFVGLTSQSVKAMAIAEVGAANATNCMLPFTVPDQFIDNNGNDVYDAGDTFVAPSSSGPGTGYTVATTYGTEFELKGGAQQMLSPGWRQALDFGAGASTYRAAISGCIDVEYGIGDIVPPKNGNMSGPTMQGIDDLIAEDPNAYWDSTSKTIKNSCVSDGTCPGYTQSPRIRPVPVFDPAYFYTTGLIRITNFFGFFVERDNGNGNNSQVYGILINVPAFVDASKGSVTAASAYLTTIYLVR
jgi:hypothetical protein